MKRTCTDYIRSIRIQFISGRKGLEPLPAVLETYMLPITPTSQMRVVRLELTRSPNGS